MLNTTWKIFFIITLFIGVNSQKVSAQYYFYNAEYYDQPVLVEIGGSINAMNCLTDLGGKKGIGKRFFKDFNIGKTQLAGGIFFSATYKNAVGLRLEGTFGKISADDNVLKGVTDIAKERFNRNLNFRSTITELSLIAELHPLFLFIDWANRDDPPPRFSPYFLVGIGYFSFNPQGQVPGTNRWVDLQPLRTEGEGFATHPDRPVYKLKQMNVPVGFGVKHELSRIFSVRLEGVYRILNTDYLDDVSRTYINPIEFVNNLPPGKAALARRMADKQIISKTSPLGGGKRGSPGEKDAYFSLNLKLALILGRQKIQ